ncbi:GAF domain-containing protein [Halorubrum lipolyticum]|uniref:PAS domain S-box protein n=1 Tax=Halorubrum lipolyticum DSM 21995 TaxID=1227482 RepID=M0NNY5_9EURY|nr:GAF domain-containing protein [Halorubrum lipolyticum]EMA59652.1 PAS domain S-box protein [Halorubrum lipolyticum DSM 21995]
MTAPESRTDAEHGTPAASRPAELLESVQRLTGVGVWRYDGDSDETWWSDQARDILGIDADTPPTFEAVAEQFVDDDRRRSRELFERARERGEAFAVEVGFMNGGTTERYLRIRGAPRPGDPGENTLHGTVRNVTDAKRQEQRIEVLRKTSQELREANSRQAVAEIMADTAKNILGLDNTTIRLVDETEGTLQVVVVTEECVTKAGTRPDYPADKDTPAARTFRTGEPELHTDHSSTEDDQERGELRSGLYVPIGDHGVLSAGDITIEAFDERDVEAASLLGQLGAKAITRIGWTRRSRAI